MYFNKKFLKKSGLLYQIELSIDQLSMAFSLSPSPPPSLPLSLPPSLSLSFFLLFSSSLSSPSQRSSRIKGTYDSTTADPPTSSLEQRFHFGGLRPQIQPIWSWLVGGQCWASFSWTRLWWSLQGRLSQRTETSSKAQKLVTCQEYLPTQGWTSSYGRWGPFFYACIPTVLEWPWLFFELSIVLLK